MKKSLFFVHYSTNLCIQPPGISGGIVEYPQGPRLQVAQPNHELSAPPSWDAGKSLSIQCQSLWDCTPCGVQ